MADGKSIEELTHDYIVAAIQSDPNLPIDTVNVENFCKLAVKVKEVCKKEQRQFDENNQRRRF